jgi:general stress protein 26
MAGDATRDLIWKHVGAIRICMMVTHDGARIHARPMNGIVRPEQNAIWFFTNRESHADTEIQENPRACLAFNDIRRNKYVSLSGTLQIVHDRNTIAALWNDEADGYFESGQQDDNVCLLKFEPEFGQYWDSPSSSIVVAIKFLEAKLMGEKPALGQSGQTEFTPPEEPRR